MAHPLNCIWKSLLSSDSVRPHQPLFFDQAMCSIAARIIRQNEELYVAGAFLKNAALDNTVAFYFVSTLFA